MKFATIWLAAASLAMAQDAAQAHRVLARARDEILAVTHRLARYTCIETIHRDYLEPAAPRKPKHVLTAEEPLSCEYSVAHPAGDLKRIGWDRVRLEVTVADRREIESWLGATRFDSRRLDQIVTTGPTSTGAFGTYLIEVFENAGAKIEFARRDADGLFEYRFEIPRASSHYSVKAGSGWAVTASSGTFTIDPATADLKHLMIVTALLPPAAQMCRASTAIDYRHLRIGDGDFLLPESSTLETEQVDQAKTQSITQFSACHEYTAESTLRFDDASSRSSSDSAASPGTALPAGLPVTLALDQEIDSDTAAAGDVVFAHVTEEVRQRRSKRVLIPRGAPVHGRISEMKYFVGPAPHFQIGLTFDRVQIGGAWTRVALALDRTAPRQLPESALNRSTRPWASRGVEIDLPPAGSGEGGVLVFATKSPRYVLPAGNRNKWVTRESTP